MVRVNQINNITSKTNELKSVYKSSAKPMITENKQNKPTQKSLKETKNVQPLDVDEIIDSMKEEKIDFNKLDNIKNEIKDLTISSEDISEIIIKTMKGEKEK